MKTLGFLVALGGTYGIATAAGASNGWAAGISWLVAIVGAIIFRRMTMYRAYAREVMASQEYKDHERHVDEFFGIPD